MRRLSVTVITTLLFTTFLCSGLFAAERRLPDVEVKQYNGRPTVFIDGKPDALPGYCPWYTAEFYEKYTPRLFPDGFGVYHLDIRSLPNDHELWSGDRIDKVPVVKTPPDFFSLDRQVEIIRKGDPDARFFIRVFIRPPNSWTRLHPAEFVISETGVVADTPSLASDAYWRAAAQFSGATVGFVESRPWADRVIGYGNFHLAEGCHIPVAEGWLYDHNPCMTQKWREFLRKKYSTVQALRKAYRDTTLTFESVGVPRDRLRGTVPEVSNILYWQNAAENRALRDYQELTRDLFHRRFRQLSAAMAGAADRKVLILHDALKQPMTGWNLLGFFAIGQERHTSWNPAYPELMAGSGSMDVTRLFDIGPGFDGLVTPHDYQARGIGGVYEPEGMADSAVLRGKFFMSEMDTRYWETLHPDGSKSLGSARNPREWAAITWRNFASGWTRGYTSYWHHSWSVAEWFHNPEIHQTMQRQIEVMRESVNWKHETLPGIAMILDDASVLETNGAGNYLNEAVMWEYKMGLARCGVPFRIYLFEDLELENFPKHRVYYFPNLFRVDDKRLEILKKKVFRDGAVVVWGPGSGISDGEKIGIEPAKKLTGFDFEMLPANAPRRILISNFEHPVTRGLDADLVIGGPLAYGPVLMPKNCTELGLAWAKGGNNYTGLGLKEFGQGAAQSPAGIAGRGEGDYAAVFTTAVNLPANLWRNLARYAGAHVYCESNDILLTDNCVVSLHSLKPERKRIALPGKFKVTDLVTGKPFSKGTSEISFDLKGPETRVFLLEK
ncbi:MAG: hypothetical protein ACYC9O_06515 [Candidatus Latescibacterota bacterium]